LVTHYRKISKKVLVSHGGSTYDLSSVTPKMDIFQEENVAWNAEIILTDRLGDVWGNKIDVDDEVWLYANYKEVEDPLTAASLRFHGYVGPHTPNLGKKGFLTDVKLDADSRCLLDLLCGESYGAESSNPGLDTIDEIITDASNGIFALWVNKLLGNPANGTGYAIDVSKVHAIAGSLPYLEYPYKPVINCLDDGLDMLQAVLGSATAGAHWIVRPIESGGVTTPYFILDHVGGGTYAEWPKWWNGDGWGTEALNRSNSTLSVTNDLSTAQFTKQKAEANYILYSGNFRKPGSGDAWTALGGAAMWGDGNPNSCARSDSDVQKIVGDHSLLLEPDNPPNIGLAYLPLDRLAHWNFYRISTPTNIPRLVFYEYVTDVNAFGYPVYLATDCIAAGGASNDYWWAQVDEFVTPKADRWIKVDLPIGPHYAMDPSLQKFTDPGTSEFVWHQVGAPTWYDINMICLLCGNNAAYDVFFDGLHFEGHVLRGAKRSGSTYRRIKAINDDVGKDDTLRMGTPGTTDTGAMARIAYAELLRASRTPLTGEVAIPGKPYILPGQFGHFHSLAASGGVYRVDADMRITLHHLAVTDAGMISYLSVTDDLLNSRPTSPGTAYNIVRKAADIEYQNRVNSSVKSWRLEPFGLDTPNRILEEVYAI
jgi:hypothetical protein